MPFLGNKPTNNFTSFEKQDITGDGSSSYTLAHAVNNEKDIDVFINFIHQKPTTAYTASGTTLTLTESISSADDCYILFRSRAILSATPPDGSVSSAKIASGAVTSAKLATNIQADTLYGKTTDGDSGIDLSTNDVVAVKTANTERLRVDASGDVTMSTDSSLTIQGTHNEGGGLLDLKGTDTPAADKNLGGLNFGNSSDRSLAMIRGVSSASDAANMRFYTEATGASIEERMRIAEGGGLLLNGNYNIHALGGVAFPQTAFQYDFNKDTYAHPMKISCAISHWNGSYMSYTEGWYWGYNTVLASGNVTSYTGTNGSWTISYPTNTIVRVRFNGDADYNHASGWYIKVEGNLRKTST